MASVDIKGVVKRFGNTTIIQGLDLSIRDREFVVLVGPSGCGKSTLLRMIAGLEEVTAGDILLDGRRINNEPPMSRDVAMVFQTYALYPHMTVAANMGFSLRMRNVPKAEIAVKVENAARILNLEPYLDRYPRQLSGGQRQRVAMGRAIVRHPKAFLFDEPLSNLDAKLRVQMRTEIKTLHRSLESTSIYVTHDQVEAMTMGDKIVVMNKGNIEQIGSPLEVYDRPRNQFVAGFIGSPAMNFIPGEAADGLFRAPGGGVLPLGDAAVPSGPVVMGVRPERLALASPDAEGGLRGTVVSVEPTGAETHVVCDLAGARVMLCTSSRPALDIGGAVALAVDPEHTHYFDPRSGRSLSFAREA